MRIGLIAILAVALASTSAWAGGKGGGGASGHGSGQHPQESVSLNYGKIEHTYTKQQSGGTATSKRVVHKHATTASSAKQASPKKKEGLVLDGIKGEAKDQK